MSHCYHCGLPNPELSPWQLELAGEERTFCCPGCHAVCQAILDSGLDDYYRFREEPALTGQAVPEILDKLTLYDRPEIQKSFVRERGTLREAALILENIRCPACLWLNEQRLRALPGIADVEIDYNSERARVRWDPEQIELSEILAAITEIGYAAHPFDPAHRDQLTQLQQRRNAERLIFAGFFAMAVMEIALVSYLMGQPDADGNYPLWVILGRWSSLLAATAILVYPAQEFFLGAWNDLKNRRLGMDVPIVLGLVTAYIGSIVTTVTQVGEVYYDSIGMFVLFVLIARRQELRGRLAAAAVIDRLAKVVPRTARRIGADGGDEEVAVVDLRPGDRLQLKPGEVVPVDAVLESDWGRFDEALITGESRPVSRQRGEAVIGGAHNGEQPVELRVTRVSDASTISEMTRLLEQGMRSRPRSAILAERAANVFIRVILVIAAATASFWAWADPAMALHHTVAVLIVTCPCALALATPVAVAIASARFAQSGILALRMNAMEQLARADLVVFDKTGTLTQGRLGVALIEPLTALGVTSTTSPDAPADTSRCLALAAALEQRSEHPIARAIRAAWESEASGATLASVNAPRNHPGLGIEGEIDGRTWYLGKARFAAGQLSAAAAARLAELERQGYSVVILGDGERAAALIALRDTPRPGLPGMLRALRAQGVRDFAILSGDSQVHVDRLAAELKLSAAASEGDLASPQRHLLGDLRPEQKLAWIRDAQAQGRRVIMVGDGVNDAATLAVADASVSFSAATDLAQAGSDFILLQDDVAQLAELRRLAMRTRRVILQNLSWAASYNLLAVPAAAVGLIPPWGAAIGMSASSLLVVGNSLRLRSKALRHTAR